MVLQSDHEFAPTEIAEATFPTVFRGYDQEAVRRFLTRLAASLEHQMFDGSSAGQSVAEERIEELESEIVALQGEIKELEAELVRRSVEQADAGSRSDAPAEFDETRAIELLGQETARVLESARSAASDILKRAEGQATSLKADAKEELVDARRQSKRLVADAEVQAKERVDRLTSEAEQRAAQVTDEASQRARRQTEEAQARADRLTAEAEEAARRVTAEADDAARRVSDEAEQYHTNVKAKATKMLGDAEARSRASQSEAEERSRQIVADAEALRRQVVAELVAERRRTQSSIDNLVEVRERLASSLAVARSDLDTVADAIDDAGSGQGTETESERPPTDIDEAEVDRLISGLDRHHELVGPRRSSIDEPTAELPAVPSGDDVDELEPVEPVERELGSGSGTSSAGRKSSKSAKSTKTAKSTKAAKTAKVSKKSNRSSSAKTSSADAGAGADREPALGELGPESPESSESSGSAWSVDSEPIAGPETRSAAVSSGAARTSSGSAGVFDRDPGGLESPDHAIEVGVTGLGHPLDPGGSEVGEVDDDHAADALNDLPADGVPLSLVEGFSTIVLGEDDVAGAATSIDSEPLDGDHQPEAGHVAGTSSGPDQDHEQGDPTQLITTVVARATTTLGDRSRGDLPLAHGPDGPMPAPFEARDVALTRSGASLRRQLRRALNDDQSELLDRLRGVRGSLSADALADRADQVAHYYAALERGMTDVAQAGAEAGGSEGVPATLDHLLAQLADFIVEKLRGPTTVAIEQGGGGDPDPRSDQDRERVLDSIRSAYRDFRNIGLPDLTDDALHEAFAIGLYASIPEGSPVRWLADPRTDPDPVCDVNRERRELIKGETFPSGHARPLALPGCRCLVAAGW